MNEPAPLSPSSQDPNAAPPPPSIALPTVAIIGSLLCSPLGVLLSIISMVKFSKATGTTAKTLSVIALAMNLLLVVPMTIGILAAIAIPNFVKFQCRSKQSEAKGNLKALYVGEETFRAETDRYSMSLSEIGFTPRGQKVRYVYRILDANARSFLAEAVGTDEMLGDRWVIDSNNQLQNTDNVCTR
jgi:type IV pilus assembly protein PilA